MTFSVNGIKQEKNEKFTVVMLICVDSPLLARKILEQKNILILSLKEYPQDKKKFGDIYFTIKLSFQEIEIVTNYQDIQEACDFFTFIGLNIVTINSYSKPIDDKKIAAIITKAKVDAQAKKLKVQEQTQQKASQDKKVYEDERLESVKSVLDRVFEKIDETIERVKDVASYQNMKKIRMYSEELKKLRMGTNLEKIKETIQDVFSLIEQINIEYYASTQNINDTISAESLVTKGDVDKELERMENIKILKLIHGKISIKNQDYAVFGPSAIYRKFLQKDVFLKLADLGGLLYYFYNITEFTFIIMIALLGTYATANEVYLFSLNQFNLGYSMVTLGIRGLLVFVAKYFRKKIISRLLLIILIVILCHHILMGIVITNLAL